MTAHACLVCAHEESCRGVRVRLLLGQNKEGEEVQVNFTSSAKEIRRWKKENKEDRAFPREDRCVRPGRARPDVRPHETACAAVPAPGPALLHSRVTLRGQAGPRGVAFPKASSLPAVRLGLVEAKWPSRGQNKDYVQDSERSRQRTEGWPGKSGSRARQPLSRVTAQRTLRERVNKVTRWKSDEREGICIEIQVVPLTGDHEATLFHTPMPQ